MKKSVAVILSGCGFKDGSEITEAVSTLINLSEAQANYSCFAPDKSIEPVDHVSDEVLAPRNMLSESARISRGQVQPLNELDAKLFDAIIFPGGFGAALHLCNWAKKGSQCEVLPDVVRVITDFYDAGKPIGAICIAPVLLAKILGHKEITITIGNDKETAQEIEKTGTLHEDCTVDDFITDRAHKIVTAPAYMYGEAPPHQVFQGIQGLVKEIVEMA